MSNPVQAPNRPVHVIGATGRSGLALCRALLAEQVAVVPVVRSAPKWAATNLPALPRVAELGDAAALQAALRDAIAIVSTVHASHAAAIIAAAPRTRR